MNDWDNGWRGNSSSPANDAKLPGSAKAGWVKAHIDPASLQEWPE